MRCMRTDILSGSREVLRALLPEAVGRVWWKGGLVVALVALVALVAGAVGRAGAAPVVAKGALALEPVPGLVFRFGGPVGARVVANEDEWLLRAPAANPGMLEMFRVRDRVPVPQLVPWAGEFAGKYLISAAQALRLSGGDRLRGHLEAFVDGLLAGQAEDGYLGPFPKTRRLLGEWDLWGHYHVMQGLLRWHDETGDTEALAAVRKAADLICRVYLDGGRRVLEAGSPEMNMAVSHVLAELHLRTGEPRYLAMVREIEKDWERAGDYRRTGEQGVPFYRTPLPRWESLHDVQTLAALWRLTGEAGYRDAFISHWRTIRAFDVRHSGAFSGGEQATGNPFAPTAIETCCTVAWMALTLDMLQLSGDARVADELELSTLSGGLGAQHPSGRWWTYNTPMDGERRASAHDIVFQARAGTPELNCCSVNGPRVLGLLADWAVMRSADAMVVNWHGPVSVTAPGDRISLWCETDYPTGGCVVWRGRSRASERVRFRIPGWAEGATASVAGEAVAVTPGTYLEVERIWRESDTVELRFPLPLRTLVGQREQAGKVSVYRGPLLLAYDQRDNHFDEIKLPRLDPAKFGEARVLPGDAGSWLTVEVPTATTPIRLRDFASAGASGTRYRSWLRVAGAPLAVVPDRRGLMLEVPLAGGIEPVTGKRVRETGWMAAGSSVRLDGKTQMLVYELPEGFGTGDFTVAVRLTLNALPPPGRIGQAFSAWCAGGDDPLRLVVEGAHLFARFEAGAGGGGTGGYPVAVGETVHVAAVKSGTRLTLYVDGEPAASAEVPSKIETKSRLAGIGGNPLYAGAPEFLAADFCEARIYGRALSEREVMGLAERSPPGR
jgi:DUF1680 family protein